MKSYRDLIVWQKSIHLVAEVYKMTTDFPKEERFGLVLQLSRCAVSIPSNIAEGYGRNSTNDYIRFLQIASGSLYELQTQLEISSVLKYLNKTDFDGIYNLSLEIERMLSSLINKIDSSH